MSPGVRKIVGAWLVVGCVMVFFQVILGGITRLTESGLSITQWKPINGIVPPLNEEEWNREFELYKEKVQYKVINEGMSLHEFKWIFFWEFFHRFWARMFIVAFVFPFAYFLYRRWLDKGLILSLIGLFVFGGLQGFVGWIMVKAGLSGLFVPPLRLTVHLVLAFILFAWTVYLTLRVYREDSNFQLKVSGSKLVSLRWFAVTILVVLFLQLFLGGIVSGMKAGLAYPTWPDMNGEFVPAVLSNPPVAVGPSSYGAQGPWSRAISQFMNGITSYVPQDTWSRAFIQLVHRLTAYTLVLLIGIFYFKSRNITGDKIFQTGLNLFPVAVLLQACIGIATVLHCVGKIPVSWGVLHQAGAMLLLAETVFVIFHLYKGEVSPTET
jgi:cytochrome c oxidase assembly protein subunit 15